MGKKSKQAADGRTASAEIVQLRDELAEASLKVHHLSNRVTSAEFDLAYFREEVSRAIELLHAVTAALERALAETGPIVPPQKA